MHSTSILKLLCGLLAFAIGCGAGFAQAPYPPVHRLTFEEYQYTLLHWRKQHPGVFTFEQRGWCADSMPIYLLKITDPAVPDADKQVCLITSLHGGPERSGCTGTLAVTEWLLSDAPEAAETRRRQIVLVMPIPNPMSFFYTDRFRNAQGVDPYTGAGRVAKIWDIKNLALKAAHDAPEIAAVMSVMDQYRPEVHADLHGTGLQEYSDKQLGRRQTYQGQIMTEVTGSAYSNYALRPWDWRVTEAMIAAGNAAGFPSDRFEADAQRTLWGPELTPLGKKLWSGQPLFYTAHYGYAKYHSMMLTLEIAWDASAVARMQGLFRIGNRAWGDSKLAAYPVDRIKSFIGHFMTSEGATAAARRESRVELWDQQSDFSLGILYPQTDGRASLVCATSPKAKAEMNSETLEGTIAAMKSRFGSQATAIEDFIRKGPEIKLAMDAPFLKAPAESAAVPIKNGIGFRLRLPYLRPKIHEVRLNGDLLKENGVDGYEAWPADGFTQVQIHVPAAKAATTDLFVVTCDYAPDVERRSGWMPPPAVMAQCKTAQADALPPDLVDVPYGPHYRQTLDLWQPKGGEAAPVVFYIHGGGWAAEDKSNVYQHLDIPRLLHAGIAVAAINYRFILDAEGAQIFPPVEAPLGDAKRALQFLRSKAKDWHLNPACIAASGVSAGGCSSLWLAMRDDMADLKSNDPIARQSTKVCAVAAKAPQATLDPKVMLEWMPNIKYGGQAFGFQKAGMSRDEAFAPYLAAYDELRPSIKQYSPLDHASADDPPVFLTFAKPDKAPVKGAPEMDPNHSVLFGFMLKEKLQPLGVSVELSYPGGPATKFDSIESFLIEQLKR